MNGVELKNYLPNFLGYKLGKSTKCVDINISMMDTLNGDL